MTLGQAILVASGASPSLLLLSPPFSLDLLPWRPSTKLSALSKHKRTWRASLHTCGSHVEVLAAILWNISGGYENCCISFNSTAHPKILTCFMPSSLFFFLSLYFLFAVPVSPCLTTRYGNRFKNILYWSDLDMKEHPQLLILHTVHGIWMKL
jgi:hypothetical protein